MRYKNILLIDDDEDDQEIFLAALAKVSASAKCLAMSKATEALIKLKRKQIEPDVIFLDLNMPVMNGQQFLLEVKRDKVLSEIPIIILSTSSHQRTISLTKELGALDYITKPSNFDEMVRILQLI